MLKPKYGQTIYYRNTGTASAAPYLSGKVQSPKPIGDYWVVMSQTGKRKLLLEKQMFKTMTELIKEG